MGKRETEIEKLDGEEEGNDDEENDEDRLIAAVMDRLDKAAEG